ncbi:hypothetical protein JWG44_00605 [Leptospira sp. 201903071]|uniref:hypothetical protein n=1 Tax=Leptospira ainazelensis TaxID=2810034 RepID=UPI00196519E5|nr:hypothetical protein [Leptospira ainazelensis]MBM9498755.1 hypothetical protein [Leptospira ainazelensis]
MKSLLLKVETSDTILPSSRIIDFEFKIRFENRARNPFGIYPKIAPFPQTIGWGGPHFGIVIQDAKMQELRSYYGPPAQPPTRNYYEKNLSLLVPGESWERSVTATWIPNSKIPKNSLSKELLDPEGYDGIDENLFKKSSMLVFNRNCSDMISTMNQREDFLKPNHLILLPRSGEFKFFLTYYQNSWVDFKPTWSLNLKSDEKNLFVE